MNISRKFITKKPSILRLSYTHYIPSEGAWIAPGGGEIAQLVKELSW